jgi:uncharacterized protein DUF6706
MTNLQALQSIIGVNYPFDANMYSKALIDQGLTEDGTYSIDNVKAIDLAFAGLIQTVLVSPDIAEGGYKITQADRNTLEALRISILNKYGLAPSTGFVTDKSNLW